MNQKIEITGKILEILGYEPTEDRIRKTIPIWWYSTRKKDNSGLRLTEQGLDAFRRAEIKEYRLKFEEKIKFNNQLLIWMDRYIDCPFYIRDVDIYVFSEKMAIQLVLFSGNVYKFSVAKSRSVLSSN